MQLHPFITVIIQKKCYYTFLYIPWYLNTKSLYHFKKHLGFLKFNFTIYLECVL